MLKEKMTNEELVVAYRDTKDERYLEALIQQNKGLLYRMVEPFVQSIPNAELDDLTQEAYIPMLRAIEAFDESKGCLFSTMLRNYVHQYLCRLYGAATCKKRYNGILPTSYERLQEIKSEYYLQDQKRHLTADCEDFNSVEFMDFIDTLNLSSKEQVAVNVIISGGTKGDVARALKCAPSTVNYYFKNIKKKFTYMGYAF